MLNESGMIARDTGRRYGQRTMNEALDAALDSKAAARRRRAAGPSARQAAKSEAMRDRVLHAAVECLTEGTADELSIALVAKRAGISRGAVQYHFSARRDLLCGAMEHLIARRLRQFREDLAGIGPDDDVVGHIVDTHWRHLNEPDFRAYQELVLAARGDPGLAEEFAPRYRDFLHDWYESARAAFGWAYLHPDVARAGNIAHYVLEGMAYGQLAGQLSDAVVSDLLEYAKTVMRDAMRQHPVET